MTIYIDIEKAFDKNSTFFMIKRNTKKNPENKWYLGLLRLP